MSVMGALDLILEAFLGPCLLQNRKRHKNVSIAGEFYAQEQRRANILTKDGAVMTREEHRSTFILHPITKGSG